MKDFFKDKNLSLNWEHFMNKFLTNNHRYNMTLNSQWIEIDTKEDYIRAISIFKKMIKLPKFTTQNMFDAETHYNLFMNEERFSKLLIHYEVFKK